MDNPRKYGSPPFDIAVIHGGPGAPGEMEAVARELSADTGVLEPIQTEDTINGQVEELKSIIKKSGNPPLILIGFSWGAWLSCILAASYPSLVGKLILVSSGPFEQQYARLIMEMRLSRLQGTEKEEFAYLCRTVGASFASGDSLERFQYLVAKTDSFDLLPERSQIRLESKQYQSVWSEAEKLRSSGQLLAIARQIECPTVAIHGDYDPHPAEGVEGPLSLAIKDFRFVLLENCGHYPWRERKARSNFYRLLKAEIGRP
jgi:pimeloyl-ACP methyl ester carboxylesterase